MDFKSFFIDLKENGRTGGLFVVVFLIFIFVAFLWQFAVALLALFLGLRVLIFLGQWLSGMDSKAFSVILFFLLVALMLSSVAFAAQVIFEIDFIRFVLPVAAITGISYSLGALKSYLCLSGTHRFIYFALPTFFASTVWIQYLFDRN